MCTLAVAFQVRSDTPLAVAAIRDELYARPSAPPRIEAGPPRTLAPVDLQAGGTWLGLNQHGLFVGATNRAGGPKHGDRVSRGVLVREALTAPSAAELHARLAALPATRHNGFHLLYADRAAAFVTWSDGEVITRHPLAPGVHVVTERSYGAGVTEREPLVLARLRALLAERRPEPAELKKLVSFHGPEDAPLDGACVHGEAFGYGTRSSFEIVFDANGAAQALWTEGHPCTEAARELTPLVTSLLGRAR